MLLGEVSLMMPGEVLSITLAITSILSVIICCGLAHHWEGFLGWLVVGFDITEGTKKTYGNFSGLISTLCIMASFSVVAWKDLQLAA